MDISVGTIMSIRPGAPATYDKLGFDAIVDWIEVGEVASIPMFGGTAQMVEFTPLGTGVVNKRKGSINYGSFTIPAATDFTDAGQVALQEGFDGANRDEIHSVKLTNALWGNIYFTALVSSDQHNIGDANTVFQKEVGLELINKPIVNADIFTVKYLAASGLSIIGETTQYVVSGGAASPVYVVNGTGTFSAWSDAVVSNPRTDTNVIADITVTAQTL